MRNVLFVCGRNRQRSPTAEQVFSEWPGLEVASAGLDDGCGAPVTPELLEWADVVVVMEAAHRARLARRFRRHLTARVVCLDIPDRYGFMDPALVKLLVARAARFTA